MTRTANEYAKKKMQLERQVADQAQENRASEALLEMSNTVSIAAGGLEALALMSKTRDWAGMYAGLAGQSVENNFLLKMMDEIFGTSARWLIKHYVARNLN
jgi:hypothetical protein